jgi:hypothetical protein
MHASVVWRSCATILIFLILTPALGAESKSLRQLLQEFDRYLVAEEYKAAAQILLSAEEQYPGAPEILGRMQRFERIVRLRRELDAPIAFRYSEQYRQILESREQLRRYFAPTDMEVAASFLATAALFLGAEYVANWVEAQEAQLSAEESTGSDESESSEVLNKPPKSSPGMISLDGVIYCNGTYYKNQAIDIYVNTLGWTRLGNVVTDSEGKFRYKTELREGSSESRFRFSGACGATEIGTSRSVAGIAIKLH